MIISPCKVSQFDSGEQKRLHRLCKRAKLGSRPEQRTKLHLKSMGFAAVQLLNLLLFHISAAAVHGRTLLHIIQLFLSVLMIIVLECKLCLCLSHHFFLSVSCLTSVSSSSAIVCIRVWLMHHHPRLSTPHCYQFALPFMQKNSSYSFSSSSAWGRVFIQEGNLFLSFFLPFPLHISGQRWWRLKWIALTRETCTHTHVYIVLVIHSLSWWTTPKVCGRENNKVGRHKVRNKKFSSSSLFETLIATVETIEAMILFSILSPL